MQSDENKTKAITAAAPAETCGANITLVPQQDTLAGFAMLFKGRTDAYGTEKGGCVHEPPDYKRHLSGTCLMGIYPLLDDGTVRFGAVDVDKKDAPDQGRGIADQIQAGLASLGLMSYLERSRSKGWHVWVFFDAPVQAEPVKRLLKRVSAQCGLPQAEVFPKQVVSKGIGHYIRLPYPGGPRSHERNDGRRAVWVGDNVLTLEQFVQEAYESRNTAEDLDAALGTDGGRNESNPRRPSSATTIPKGAPLPCMTVFLEKGAFPGQRDESLFTAAKHCRRNGLSEEEAFDLLCVANGRGTEPVDQDAVRAKIESAYRGPDGEGYTSCGCDNPLWTDGRCPGKEKCPVFAVTSVRTDGSRDTWPYAVENGRIVYLEGARDRGPKPVCDFDARITEQSVTENGGRIFTLAGETVRGVPFSFEIGADAFSEDRQLQACIVKAAGAGAVVYHRMSSHVRPAIQKLSEDAPIMRRYERTGWADGKFLIPGREPEGTSISLPSCIPYCIDASADLRKGLEALESVIHSQRPEVSTVVLSAIFQAPIAQIAGWKNARYGMFIAGRTGCFKTSIARMMMAIFGPKHQSEDTFLRFGEGATINAIRSVATIASDLPLFIDNYKPSTGNGTSDFIKLTHSMMEGGEKLRQNRSAELRDARPIYAWPIVTGEDIPMDDAATLARILVVSFAWQRQEGNPNLSKAQEQFEHLCAVGGCLLDWLETDGGQAVVRRRAGRLAERREKWRKLLTSARPDMANSARVATNLAVNEITWAIVMECPALGGVASKYATDHLNGLHEVACDMAGRGAVSLEAVRFLDALRDMLASGKFGVEMRNTPMDPELGRTLLGWTDNNENYLLLPDLTFEEVDKFLKPTGGLGGVSKNTVYDQLKELNYIASTDGKQTTKTVKVGGKSRRVLHLKKEALEAEAVDD